MAAALDASPAPSPQVEAPSPAKRRWNFRWPAFGMRPALGLLSVAVVALLVWNVALQTGGGANPDAFVRYVGNEQVHAHIYFVENVGVMTIDGLDPLPSNETYQAWSVLDGSTRSLGVLDVSDNGDGYVLLSNHVTNNEPVFVTIEPSGGSTWPSGATVLSSQQQ
jgi:anti-sigma-K factor RskA